MTRRGGPPDPGRGGRAAVREVEDRSDLPKTGRRRSPSPSTTPPENAGRRARAYSRYSSLAQKDRSETRQYQSADLYAAAVGLEINGRYSDRATSGATMVGRRGLHRMLADAAAGEFDVLIVEQVDRLARDEADFHLILRALKRAGVQLHESLWGKVTGLVAGVKGNIASQARVLFLERARDGRRRLAMAGGVSNRRAYGYVPDGRSKGGQIRHPHRSGVVERIFEQLALGSSPSEVAEGLRGVEPTPKACVEADLAGSHPRTDERGTAWARHMVVEIARAPIYMGLVVDGRTERVLDLETRRVVSQRHVPFESWDACFVGDDAIVSVARWQLVQHRLGRNYYGGRSEAGPTRFMLFGKVACGVCGMPAERRGCKDAARYECAEAGCGGFGRPRLEWVDRAAFDVLLDLAAPRAHAAALRELLERDRRRPKVPTQALSEERQALEARANEMAIASLKSCRGGEDGAGSGAELDAIERRIEEIDALLDPDARPSRARRRPRSQLERLLASMASHCGRSVPLGEDLDTLRSFVRAVSLEAADGLLKVRVQVNLDALMLLVAPSESSVDLGSSEVTVDLDEAEGDRASRCAAARTSRRAAHVARHHEGGTDVDDQTWASLSPVVEQAGVDLTECGWTPRRLLDAMLLRARTKGGMKSIPERYGPPLRFEAACRLMVLSGAWDAIVAKLKASSSPLLDGADLTRMDVQSFRRKASKRLPADASTAERQRAEALAAQAVDPVEASRLRAVAERLAGKVAGKVARGCGVSERHVAAWHHLYRTRGPAALSGRCDDELAAMASADLAALSVGSDDEVTRRHTAAVARYLAGEDPHDFATEFGSTRNVVRLWIFEFLRGGVEALRRRPKPSCRLTRAQLEELRGLIAAGVDPDDPSQPMNRRVALRICQDRFGAQYTFLSFANLLKREGMQVSTRTQPPLSPPTLLALRTADRALALRDGPQSNP